MKFYAIRRGLYFLKIQKIMMVVLYSIESKTTIIIMY